MSELRNIHERLEKVVYLATEENLGAIKQLISDCKYLMAQVEKQNQLKSTDESA